MRELIIDLDAIAQNLQTMRAKTNGAMAMAVVKADAYGHGMIPVAKKLEVAGADYLGVADIDLEPLGVLGPADDTLIFQDHRLGCLHRQAILDRLLAGPVNPLEQRTIPLQDVSAGLTMAG